MRSISKRSFFVVLAIFLLTYFVEAQKNRPTIKPKITQSAPQIVGAKGVVVDERLSLLRIQPSLYFCL